MDISSSVKKKNDITFDILFFCIFLSWNSDISAASLKAALTIISGIIPGSGTSALEPVQKQCFG